jgi:hypothetical protein
MILLVKSIYPHQYLALGGVIGLPAPGPPYVSFCFFSAGLRI